MTAGVLVVIVALIIAGDRVLAGDPLTALAFTRDLGTEDQS